MARAHTADPDPLLYLVPILGAGALANFWPAFEFWCNVVFTAVAVLGALYLGGWLLWVMVIVPYPSKRGRVRDTAEEEGARRG